jgi:hypothetical protein
MLSLFAGKAFFTTFASRFGGDGKVEREEGEGLK